ncbi:hypothetical protein GCM10010466_40210 [Planomonospora alba]|uniref:Aminoglycoside phosphotransferase n=1 Tax=Planomonospora alba TaxID=161354 RepID=A0ABP6NDZ4_9ACTN
MAVERLHWDDLPNTTRAAVEKHTGTIWSADTVSEGLNSAIAAVLDTATGPVFAKGLRCDYPRRWTQDMEALINPHVTHLSPRLLWRVDDGDWDLLGFEAVDGRHADYRPGSPDLDQLVETMTTLGQIRCPELPVKAAEHRWRTYVTDPADLDWFAGDRLLHTDYNPVNVLMSGGRALLIDWAWPTRGAGWIDPACLILRLMAAGHTATEADQVAARIPAWTQAPAEGVAALARANVHLWQEIEDANPTPWVQTMNRAARDWLTYRT